MKQTYLLSVAPMLGWSNRHCRYFHRLITPNACLYTEMVTTGALLYGDIDRYLAFNLMEKPLVLQLGGSNSEDLAGCVAFAKDYGFNEINLNCGCPSERVKKGAFGASLMMNPGLVADCWQAMRESCNLPITVKHRIGVDNFDDYSFLFAFVHRLYLTGCRDFIIHARKALLNGLTPKENRDIPPLIYQYVYKIKKDFPDCRITVNGGIKDTSQVLNHLQFVDGVMIGREAYKNPIFLLRLEMMLFHNLENLNLDSILSEVEEKIFSKYINYVENQLTLGEKLSMLVQPLLGWRRGYPQARVFRQILSDVNHLNRNNLVCLIDALKQFDILL